MQNSYSFFGITSDGKEELIPSLDSHQYGPNSNEKIRLLGPDYKDPIDGKVSYREITADNMYEIQGSGGRLFFAITTEAGDNRPQPILVARGPNDSLVAMIMPRAQDRVVTPADIHVREAMDPRRQVGTEQKDTAETIDTISDIPNAYKPKTENDTPVYALSQETLVEILAYTLQKKDGLSEDLAIQVAEGVIIDHKNFEPLLEEAKQIDDGDEARTPWR